MAQKAHRYVYPEKKLIVPVHDLVDEPAEEARRRGLGSPHGVKAPGVRSEPFGTAGLPCDSRPILELSRHDDPA